MAYHLPLLLHLGLKAKKCGVAIPKLIQYLCFQNLQMSTLVGFMLGRLSSSSVFCKASGNYIRV